MLARLPKEIGAIRAALAARGYESDMSLPGRPLRLRPGSTIAIQFAGQVLIGPKGVPQLIVDCAAQVNADEGASTDAMHLIIEKAHAVRSDPRMDLALKISLSLAVDADFCLPGQLTLGRSAIQSANAYCHLQGLVADARDTIRSLIVDPHRIDSSGSPLRIQARLLGDVAIGHSGLVRPHQSTCSQDYVRCSLAACDWMQKRLLPDLRLVMRSLSGTARQTAGSLAGHPSRIGQAAGRLPPIETTITIPELEALQ